MPSPRAALIATGMLAATLVASAGVSGPARADSEPVPAWSYTADTGPSYWGSLSPEYSACAVGSTQSPIDIVRARAAHMRDLVFDYRPGEAGVFNNGHTVEAEPMDATSTLRIGRVTYPFTQLHFHSPSEHEVGGRRFALEIHFVHTTAAGQVAVVGVFAKEGKRNPEWAKIVNVIPAATADPQATTVEDLDWARLLPRAQRTIRYLGSLTTPPCSEGVRWNLMSTPIEMSRNQIRAFTAAYSGNNRPVQPLNGRIPVVDVRSTDRRPGTSR